jgi:hypothetical protein
MDDEYHSGTATDALNEFKEGLFGRRDIILHTADFTRSKEGFEAMATHDFRVRFFEKLRTSIMALDFKVIACVVRKEEHLKKYGLHAVDPYLLSLSILIERFIFECDSRGGSVIAEARDATLNNALELAFLDLKIRGTTYVSAIKVQKRIHNFAIRDKRENITGLQVADICATPIGRRSIGRNTYPSYSSQGDFYRTVEQKFRRDWRGNITGAGLVLLPK